MLCPRSSWPTLALAMTLTTPVIAAEDPSRLKRDVIPISESIRLDIDPAQKSYSGTATIAIQVVTATSSFRLHARDMKLDRVTLSREKNDLPVTTESGRSEERRVG